MTRTRKSLTKSSSKKEIRFSDLPQDEQIKIRDAWARGFQGISFSEFLQSNKGAQVVARIRANNQSKSSRPNSSPLTQAKFDKA